MLGDTGRKCQTCPWKMGSTDCAEFGGRCYDVQVIESGGIALSPGRIAPTCEKCSYGKCTKLWRSQIEAWKGPTAMRRACIAAVEACLDANGCSPHQVSYCMHFISCGAYPCQAFNELPTVDEDGKKVTRPQAM